MFGERVVRTTCHICHGGCILFAHVKDGKVQYMEGDPEAPHNRGSLCPKGAAAPQIIHSPYRIKYPMKRIGERGKGKWQRISWDEAFNTIVEKLKYYKEKYGGESIAYAWGTGRQVLLTPWWNFFNEVIGTPNGIGVGHMCLTKTRASLTSLTLGKIHGPTARAEFRDFDQAACIVGWGDTLIESTNDRMALAGRRITDSLKRGTKLIVIDPVYTRAAQKANIWLPIRPGTDLALAMAWQNIIISDGLYDREFVVKWTNAPFLWRIDTKKLLRLSDVTPKGDSKHFVVWDTVTNSPQVWNAETVSFEKAGVEPALTGTYVIPLSDGKKVECNPVWQLMIDNVKEWTAEKTAEVTWLPPDKIRESAKMYATNKPASIEWGVSMSQQTRCTATNQAILHLKTITGNLDIPGGQPFWQVPGFRSFTLPVPREQEAKRITGGFVFNSNPDLALYPSAHQPAVWKAIVTGEPYPIKCLFISNSNFLTTHEGPDKHPFEALKKLEFILATDLIMTPSNEFADMVLPLSTAFERDWVSDTYEVGVFAAQAVIEPLYESKSDFDVYRELCRRFGREDIWPWKTEKEYCDWQLEPVGITYEELCKTCFKPAADIWKKYEKGILRKDGKPGFETVSGKVEMYLSLFEKYNLNPLPVFSMPPESYETTPELAKEYPLILITGSRELNFPFFHSQYREIPGLRELKRFPALLINPETAGNLGIKNGNWAWVETKRGKSRFKAEVTERIHPKIVSVPHCWWYPELPGPLHGVFESSANVLTANAVTDSSLGADPAVGTSELRGLLCKVYKADGPPPGVADESYK